MEKIVFATNNAHKLEEVRSMMSGHYKVLSLKDIGCDDVIPETSNTLEGNAQLKANYVFSKYGYVCFADDTGLEVDALDGAPGVYSARYSGEECDSAKNMALLLKNMEGKNNRRACFRTVIAMVFDGEMITVNGKVEGEITVEPSGYNGFGYDPIFRPTGFDKTFAEMTDSEKNSISHRKRAIEELLRFLNIKS